MNALPGGCSRSPISVIPTNWHTKKASTKKPWRIFYRFYDPQLRGTALWGKLIPVKGMNRHYVLEERQAVTRSLLEDTKAKLDNGYNPITGRYYENETPGQDLVKQVTPATKFIEALTEAEKLLDVVPDVHTDMRSIIKGVKAAAEKLTDNQLHKKYTDLLISQVQSRHLTYIFEQCSKDNPRFSAKRQNRYKAYLSMIFGQLITLQAIKDNPTTLINDKKVVKKKRAILTDDEAAEVDTHVFTKDYFFWRYMHIFYHSGARNTEMLYLQKDGRIDLDKGEFTIVQKKGGEYKEVKRIISKEVTHLWKEILEETQPGEYLFSTGFRPGDHRLYQDRPTKKWHELVKASKEEGGLGIDKDFYPLKHRRSDIVAKKLSLKHAQEAMGHTSEKTAIIYAVNEKERQLEQVKNLDVKFAG